MYSAISKFIAIFYFFLLFSHVVNAKSIDLSQRFSKLPAGVWVSNSKQDLSLINAEFIRIRSYQLGLVVLELERVNGDKSVYPVFDPQELMIEEFDDRYLDEGDDPEAAKFVQISDTQIEFRLKGLPNVLLTKQQVPRVKTSKLAGTWSALVENRHVEVSIDSSGEVLMRNAYGDLITANLVNDENAGLLLVLNQDGERIAYQLRRRSNSKLSAKLSTNGDLTLDRISAKPISQFVLDSNGNPVVVDQLNVKTELGELTAETTVDLRFTNPNRNSSEVAFKLPLPANAVVTGYSLDINGQMIPSSAVEKERAREAFEKIEARGVDPAIADISSNNQFSTEIFPVEYQQQRRIIVRYIEPLERDRNNRVSYSFPIHRLGAINRFEFELLSDASKPKVRGLTREYKKIWQRRALNNVDSSGWQLRASAAAINASKAITSSVRRKITHGEIAGKLSFAPDGRRYLKAAGLISKQAYSKIDADRVVIAWDTSLSMQAHHARYLELLEQYLQVLSGVDLRIYTYADSDKELALPSGDIGAIKLAATDVVYDGATDFNSLRNVLQKPADYYVVFSDGLATFTPERWALNDKSVFTVSPSNVPVNAPLLQSLSENGNYFSLGDNNARKIAHALGTTRPMIEIESANSGLQDVSVIRADGFNRQFYIAARLAEGADNISNLSVSINGAKAQIAIDSKEAVSQEGKHLWVQAMLRPWLAQPKRYREKLVEFGKMHHVATPFTSLIVLENFEDYVEFGIQPPEQIPGAENYAAMREDILAQQGQAKESAKERVYKAWRKRLAWWADPMAYFKPRMPRARNERDQFQSQESELNFYDDESLQEIVVTAAKRISGSPITLEPWAPDVPYMRSINAADTLEKKYQAYLAQRSRYQTQVSFYMDMAKHFFALGENEPAASSLGVKIVLNILEISPDRAMMQRTVAYLLMQYEFYDLAILVLEKVHADYPFEATSKRDLARALEGRARLKGDAEDYKRALQNYLAAALDSDDEPDGLPVVALTEMNRLIPDAKRNGVDTTWIDPELLGHQSFDVRVLLSWSNSQTDVDLHVVDPNGVDVYYGNRHSKVGGHLPYDNTAGFGPEVFLLKDAIEGEFKIKAEYYSNSSVEAFGPVTLILDLFLNYGKENELRKTSSVRVDSEKDEIEVGSISF